MAEVVKLLTHPVNPDAVELLERILADAKEGEIESVAIVAVRRAGEVETVSSQTSHYHQLNSGAARLAAALASASDDCG